MDFVVLTIFPDMCRPFWEQGMVRRGIDQGLVTAQAMDIREFTSDRHRSTDDTPYGGGCGMVMTPEPLAAAIREAKTRVPEAKTVFLTPQGRPFNQRMAEELSGLPGLILVCGRYEGVDERISRELVDMEISLGDFILTGGELGALVVMDAVARLLPGVLGGETSAAKDSFSDGLLEYAQYTRPRTFEGEEVPEVLLSGHHGNIETWRHEDALVRTFLKRPDLLHEKRLTAFELDLLKKWRGDVDTIIRTQTLCGSGSPSGGE